MSEENSELSAVEREERSKELPKPFIDWNKVPLDDMVKYLEDLHMFSSSAESKCIFELIEFYKRHNGKPT